MAINQHGTLDRDRLLADRLCETVAESKAWAKCSTNNPARCLRSGTKKCQWHDGDTVWSTVGVRAGGDHHLVREPIAELVTEPVQVADVVVNHRSRELDLDSDHPLGSVLDDEVHLAARISRPKVSDLGVSGSCVDPH